MKKPTNRRAQTRKPPKSGNRQMAVDFQELRRSSATSPHRSEADYRRKPKHPKKGWE